MKRIIILFFICLLIPTLTKAQCTSSQERPSWTEGFFQERDNSYIEAVSAKGYTEEEARNKAANIAIDRRSLATGRRVNVQVQGNNVVVSGDDDLTVKSRIIDEYREFCDNGQYRVSLLVQTAKNPQSDFERVTISEQYPFSPRVFVPGMAQLHKGSTTKGAMFISGEVALIGAVVAFEGLRSSYESKIKTTHNAKSKQNYINKADNMQNLRNGFIAGAVALYAWNVIDGIVGKGKKHVTIGETNIRILPYATSDAGGISLAINF